MREYKQDTTGAGPIVTGDEVERITRQRKAYEYKARRDSRQTKRFKTIR